MMKYTSCGWIKMWYATGHTNDGMGILNDDYGIDLSIEIDKAIKRGEKPSVIAQIKKYQEQQESYEKIFLL